MYTEPWKDGGEEAMIKASVKEIGIVRNAFPLVPRAEAVLAMAAWFSVLLLVDDLVEDMGTAQAHEALSTSIRILRGSSAAYPDEPEKPVAKVCHAVRSLWARINYLLDEPAANAMLMDIKACLEGQLEELQYRQLPCSSLSQYARVRRHTIGAMPFLTLVCLELNNHISAKDAKALTALKDLVVSIVFLQNDMVGLEKDLAEGTTMNTFMVMSHSRATSPVPTPGNLLEVASQHNALVSEVLARYRTMFSLQSSDGYRLAAESVISFISTHLIWAKRSKRYTLG
ncbi:hypothetical protein MPH_02708 [Macrophomina phaseolina MS6]|uniref:Terpenoid synthase n=1 Tax=Macrophomina phaseolina (strain MS6) TaxID=1126212 RepID=K2RZ30_MACPH|nr:hypothetical protein MPH_02708 [Macrophomina phaseolina MS6]